MIVYKSDRMSRDGIESLQIEKLFLKRKVAYLSVTEGSLAADSVDDEFMRFIRAGLNQRERKVISMRTKRALNRKRERGEKIGGQPRYGWKVINGELIPNPDEQAMTARIKDLKATGTSLRRIAETVTAEGARTRKGTAFTATQVHRIARSV